MLTYQILDEDSIVVVEPFEPLSAADFADLRRDVDRYLEREKRIRGLLIVAEKFPGWEDFAGFTEHMKFVREHHRSIAKVAVVSGGGLTTVVPKFVRHFVQAEIRTFDDGAREEAMRWLKEE